MNEKVERYPGVPPQLQEILNTHPRLDGMCAAPPNCADERRIIEPADPPSPGESQFLLLRLYTEDPFGEHSWINKPKDVWLSTDVGHGIGFGAIKEKPVIKEPNLRPWRRPDLFAFIGWHVASRRFVDAIAKFDPAATTTLPIEWKFRWRSTDDFVFFEVKRLVDAYDYSRSVLDCTYKWEARCLEDLGYPRALKRGAGEGLHIFRDYYRRRDVFVSRQLAKAFIDAGMRGIRFDDLVTGKEIELEHPEFQELNVEGFPPR